MSGGVLKMLAIFDAYTRGTRILCPDGALQAIAMFAWQAQAINPSTSTQVRLG